MIKLSRDCINEEGLPEPGNESETLPRTENQADNMGSSMQYHSKSSNQILLQNNGDAQESSDSPSSDIESGDNSFSDEKASDSFEVVVQSADGTSYATSSNPKLPNGVSFEGKPGSGRGENEVVPRLLPSTNQDDDTLTGGAENGRISTDDSNACNDGSDYSDESDQATD